MKKARTVYFASGFVFTLTAMLLSVLSIRDYVYPYVVAFLVIGINCLIQLMVME